MSHVYAGWRSQGQAKAKTITQGYKRGGPTKVVSGKDAALELGAMEQAAKRKPGKFQPDVISEGPKSKTRLDKRARGGGMSLPKPPKFGRGPRKPRLGTHNHINIMVAPKGDAGGMDAGNAPISSGGAPPMMMPKGSMAPMPPPAAGPPPIGASPMAGNVPMVPGI
jgi:hypothetical protein